MVLHPTPEEVQAILDAPDPRTRLGTRDRAMLHVCFAGGLRASELVGLRVDDVSLVPRPSIRVLGKGRRERLWFLALQFAFLARADANGICLSGKKPGRRFAPGLQFEARQQYRKCF